MVRYFKFFIIISIVTTLFLSCSSTSTTDINKRNFDGSPIWTTKEPFDADVIYGIGSAKLSNDKNSRTASEAQARVDLSSKIKVIIYEGDSSNTATNDTKTAEYSQLMQTVLKNIFIAEQWKSKDGTWWTLLSICRNAIY